MQQRASLSSFAALSAVSVVWAACGPAPKDPETVDKAVSPPQTVTCPEGKVLKGLECVPAEAPKPACPEGQVEQDGECKEVRKTCPEGSTPGADGRTCIAIETPDMRRHERQRARGDDEQE